MENKAKATKVLSFKATVSLGSFYDESSRETKDFVSVMLISPFDDEDFTDTRIEPKWKDAKGTFNYKAKKALKLQDNFELNGEIRKVSYYNKKKKRYVDYPGMFVKDPFGNDREIEFGVKREEDAAVFSMLASEYFNEALESETAETESPLN